MLAEKLAAWVYDLSWSDLDKTSIEAAKLRFLDSLGCALGAANSQPVKIARKVAASRKAFVYGTMIRYLDFNDIYISSKKEISHPSDNVGAILAVAESEGSSGKDTILATVLAYELQCRLSDAVGLRLKGWDHVVYGLISSGLAAAKLMGLSKGQMTQAINLTLTSYLSTRQVREGAELSMWKASAFSNVSRNAIFAARLARQGMTGPAPAFEGKYGFWKMASGRFDVRLGKPSKVKETWIKKWPAETHSQSAIEACLSLRKGIDVRNIQSITVDTHKAGYTIIGTGKEKWKPKTRETADHSLPYIVAATLLDGKVGANTFSERKLKDRRLLQLVSKVKTRESKELTRLYPRAAANKVSVKLKGGKHISKKVIYQKGHVKNPMSASEAEGKFMSLAQNKLGKAKTKRVVATVNALQKQRDVRNITKLLRG